ncbi:hypothetical protein BKA65DRAFT_568633 [Rhexocercosporidium sp. MPI-PUGE-AT-0058]|nr:hypothetical protein BKA65DRAFT_568633 [Rhexocercosporidium sp. MPI-PUGE-AT-0058]
MVSFYAKVLFPTALLILATLTTATSTPHKALENIWNIFNSTNRVNLCPNLAPPSTIGHNVRREAQLGTHSINLEPGVDFQDCVAAPHCKGMCTFSFIEHSSWQSHAVLHIYDTYCNQIGENTAVPRDFLADPRGWGFSSNLPLYLVLHVPRLWNQDQPADVKWDYGNNRNMGAFANNMFGDAYASTSRIPSVYMTGNSEGSYTVGRAGFLCNYG